MGYKQFLSDDCFDKIKTDTITKTKIKKKFRIVNGEKEYYTESEDFTIHKDVLKMDLQGIYKIENLINGKIYVGSAANSFRTRFNHHFNALIRGEHKNKHLQSSFNKHGSENFVGTIIEIWNKDSDVDLYDLETQYFQKFDVLNSEKGYNINKYASSLLTLPEESKKLRLQKNLESIEGRSEWFDKVKNGTNIKDCPDKIRAWVSSFCILDENGFYISSKDPWNKGLIVENTDHLKKPKTVTPTLKKAQKLRADNKRNAMCKVEVFNEEHSFGIWENAKDLEEWSKDLTMNNLPIKSRFKAEYRLGVHRNTLQYVNIIKAIRNKEEYKGLKFKYVDCPTSEQSEDIKSDELLESEMPISSQATNHLVEGSETTGEKMGSLNDQN